MTDEPFRGHRIARPTMPTLILVATVAVIFFASGFYTSRLLNEGRVREDGRRRFQEYLRIADSIGVIDRQKLDELIITMSESEWEDRDAAERDQEGAKR